MSEQSDTPDTPPEVIARQGKSRALTRETADLIKSPDFIDDGGRVTPVRLDEVTLTDMAARKARTRAEAYVGGTPVKGISPELVTAIKNRGYEDAPEMDVELGDRTPAFVNWLYATHPDDAKVRYAYRDIWPTALPADWPRVEVQKLVGLHNPNESLKAVAPAEDPQAELARLRAENAELKKKPMASAPRKRFAGVRSVSGPPTVKPAASRKVPSRAKPEVTAGAPANPSASSTSASS